MALISQNKGFWLIIQNNELVLLKNNTPPAALDVTQLTAAFINQYPLGEIRGRKYFCAEINSDLNIQDSFNVLPLRGALSLLDKDNYGMAVKAYSVIHWDKTHQFCGCCGAKTIHQGNGFERSCPICLLSFFPRISPSIIVLIKNNDHVLMARSPHFPAGIYGLIAGFVEAGESLEEAVHREVKEEVGLEIKNLSYFGSQPWPFPDSLMVAFMAEYSSGDIVMDKNEIEDAAWYKYDNLPGRPSTKISIAAKLLDYFVRLCR